MKIKTIAISNSLSFALQEPELAPNVIFETKGNKGSQHILIGPNGAGKSNFIEIISHCFRKALFRSVHTNEGLLMASQAGEYTTEEQLRQILTRPNEQVSWNLRQHDGSGSEIQKIVLSLELNDNDFTNIEFLLNHAKDISEIFAKYSNTGIVIPADTVPDLRSHSMVSVTIEYRATNNNLSITFDSEADPAINLIKSYLRDFQAIQMSISLYNRYLKKPEEALWAELQQTFALLGSYRSYAGINSGISVEANRTFQPVYERLKNESTRSGGSEEPAVFEMVKRKIGYTFYDLYEDYSRDNSLEKLYTEEPLVSINNLLSKYLKLHIKVRKLNKIDSALEMYFERNGKRIETTDLSSGEKGILHFIFTLYGFDLENGVIIIDEPELHLHPQIQKEYQEIIESIQGKLDIQFIIATHSPLFIGVDTIEEVYRFYKKDAHTEIIHPAVPASQKGLVKILDLTNAAKIFFVNKVILVEGETDEYFLRFLLDYLKTNPHEGSVNWERQENDYEIINIKGKGARTIWSEFLQKFGLQVSFIGDWDNIAEVASFNLAKYTDIYQKALTTAGLAIQQKGSADGAALFAAIDRMTSSPTTEHIQELKQLKDYIAARVVNYPALVKYIQTTDPSEWTRLESAIDNLYFQKIFILKQGEMEDYLGLKKKGIEHMVEFCQNQFTSWLSDSAYDAYRSELNIILQKIFE